MYTVSVRYFDGSRRVIPFESESEARWEADEARANIASGLVRSVSMRGPVALRIPPLPKRLAAVAA